jgi:8-oxo-dGTP pyrophosphatase MutT (NUDIX family)
MAVAPIRRASTVVLLRSAWPEHDRRSPPASGKATADKHLEVFLVRRHDSLAFMSGAHVFPGGRVDDADAIRDTERFCDGLEAAPSRMRDLPANAAIAHHVAAIRELFEEAGILLARREQAIIDIDGDAGEPEATASRRRRWQSYRQQLATGAMTLPEIAAREQLRLALDELAYFAHWVTPEIETRRFDTRFFVAAVPPNQNAAHDEGETTHGEWIRPADAIARCLRDEIALPPPTWTTLRQLEVFATVADVMTWARTRDVPRVQPGFIEQGDRRIVIVPEEAMRQTPPGLERAETRFLLEGGRWRPIA